MHKIIAYKNSDVLKTVYNYILKVTLMNYRIMFWSTMDHTYDSSLVKQE
jgi:hypothetical protein